VSCDLETALRALRRGHVRWDQLPRRLASWLYVAGHRATGPWGTDALPGHLRVLQHNEHPSGKQRRA
jgi:hypothetical protein